MAKIHLAKPGDVVNKIAIRVGFDIYFEILLIGEYLRPLPRTDKKRPPTYQVLKTLPDDAAYAEIRRRWFTHEVGSLYEDAKSATEDLGSELRDWHSNLPDGANNSDKASDIDEAASAHENLSWPDLPDCAQGVMVCHLPSLDQDSRPKRCAEVIAKLDSVLTALQEKVDEMVATLSDAERAAQEADDAGTPAAGATRQEWEAFSQKQAAAERVNELAQEAKLSEDPRMFPGEENTPYFQPETTATAAAAEPEVDTQQLGEDIEELRQFIQDVETVRSELETISYPAMM